MTTDISSITLADLVLLEHDLILRARASADHRGVRRQRDHTITALDAAMNRLRDRGAHPDDPLAAMLLVGITDVVTRDMATVVDDVELALRFWLDLATRAPDGYAAPPWAIRAILSWQRGDRRSALRDAWAALEDNPDYTMAQYVVTACRHHVPMPQEWTDGSVDRRRQRLGGGARG